jgi:MFS family permease
MFAYGFLAVILALYLSQLGLSETQIGLLFTLTLLGDVLISFWMTTNADRRGRKNILIVGAALMFIAGIVFATSRDFVWLTLAAIVGVISPSGKEIGPFLAVEHAALTQLIDDRDRTNILAWHNLVGSFATAIGALVAGGVAQTLRAFEFDLLNSYRAIVIGYALIGALLAVLFTRLGAKIEAPSIPNQTQGAFGLHKSHRFVAQLSLLFALDAFAGGFIIDSFLAYWFDVKFGVSPLTLGSIFFGANLLAGVSSLAAAALAKRFGLINTMVWTHAPSNLLLLFVPLMPTLPLAAGALLLRSSISQMDVPTRQSYVMGVVEPSERSAASGVTTFARSIGSSLAPTLTGWMLGASLLSLPFFLAGGLKLIYDFSLYRSFIKMKPTEERESNNR